MGACNGWRGGKYQHTAASGATVRRNGPEIRVLRYHLRFVTRDTDEYKPSINTAYQKERQLLLDSSFPPFSSTAKKESNWANREKSSEPKSSNWGQPANESNWSKNETSKSMNWGQPAQSGSNWGNAQTEKSEPANGGQSEQDNQPKQSLMPRRKRARNSESGDFDTRDSVVCTALKKTVTNIHASASAYVPTMNKG